jgi:hypothetical protein
MEMKRTDETKPNGPPTMNLGNVRGLPIGMDYWWERFCDEIGGTENAYRTTVKRACEFAQWFALECARWSDD